MPPPRFSSDQEEFEIRTTDYVHFVHKACNADAKVIYLGLDPIVPKISVRCPTCGKEEVWKLYNADGFPAKSPEEDRT